jgi:hypothetical protein
MANYKDITGTIVYLNEMGCGFIKPTSPIGAHSSRVFFTKESLSSEVGWADLKLNQNVSVPEVVSKNCNLIAVSIFLKIS